MADISGGGGEHKHVIHPSVVVVYTFIYSALRRATREAVDKLAKRPEEKIFCLFDVLENWFSQDSFHGCPFVSAMGEFGERSNPIFQEAVLHKRLMLAYFAELTRDANIDDPECAAEEVNLLYEGAITMAKLTGKPETAQQAKSVFRKIFSPSNTTRPTVENQKQPIDSLRLSNGSKK